MTALNFQAQFAPDILAGLKPHTLRARRVRPIKPGDRLQLYTGMRTRFCRLLGEALCISVTPVQLNVIEETCQFGQATTLAGHTPPNYGNTGQFARADGFRREADMYAFFAPRAEGGVFTGDLICWGRTFKRAEAGQ